MADIEERAPVRKKFRLDFGDENAWCEHVEGDTYRALNHCINGLELKLPVGVKGLPVGHPGPDENGRMVRVHWGHLLQCKKKYEHSVEPLFIIGWDGRPCADHKEDEHGR